MVAVWRMLREMFNGKRADRSDPETERAVSSSKQREQQTRQLLQAIADEVERGRLERARLAYNERLHGTRHSPHS